MSVTELIYRYKESISWVQSLAMEIEITMFQENNLNLTPKGKTHLTFRHDGKRTEWIQQMSLLNDEGNIDQSTKKHLVYDVMTGNRYASVMGFLNEVPLLATISRDYEERQKRLLNNPSMAGPLLGRMYGNSHSSLPDLLNKGGHSTLYEKMECINEISCYIVETKSKDGIITAWIAPEKGYNTLRWKIQKSGNDLFDGKPISNKINTWTVEFNAKEFEKIGDAYTIKKGDFQHTVEYNDGTNLGNVNKYIVNNTQLNPDFEAMGAFHINLPNGTPINLEYAPGIRYVWQDGKPVVVVNRS